MQPLRNILKELCKSIGPESGFALNIIRKQWTDIVGQTVAAHTFPDMIKGKALIIIVDTPQWMHHLSFFKGDIAGKLESYDLKDIRFRLGRIPAQTENRPEEHEVRLSDDDARFLENTVRHVKDEELKRKFEKLILHGLTRGKGKTS